MTDKRIVLAKVAAIDRHLGRIRQKSTITEEQFLQNLDCQESILFNLQMAIQNCADLAAHIVSDENLGLVGSTNELFYLLEQAGIITQDLTEKIIKAVGFRNLLVHEYGQLDLKLTYHIAKTDISDIEAFAKKMVERFG